MRIVSAAVNRPVATIVCTLAVILLGVYSLFRLSVDFLPDIDVPRLIVRTECPGMNARDVEEYVTRPLESAVSAVSSVRRLRSVSREGLSFVDVAFRWGSDMDLGFIQVRSSLDQGRLPMAAGRPTILRFNPSVAPIMTLIVTGSRIERPRSRRDYDEALMELKEVSQAVIKRRLEQIDGVAYVQVGGGLDREIRVYLDMEKCRRHNIGFDEVETSLKQFNVVSFGGAIREGYSRFPLRIQAEFTSVAEVGQIPVRLEPEQIRLMEVARIEKGYRERRGYTRLNGREVITLHLFKDAGSNTVETSEKVYGDLYRFSLDYPDFEVRPVFDQADFIRESVDNVLQSLYLGGLFAFISLVLFLRDFRNPIIVGLSIPVSIIASFVCMYFLDIQFNVVSLGGLALGIGILVDNSIVVLENIFRHRELHTCPRKAAVSGTNEVGLAITASTLTTMAVFLPLVYIRGMAGALFFEQAATISVALAASLIVSIVLLPMLASRQWKPGRVNSGRFRHIYRFGSIGFIPLVWTIDQFQRLIRGFFSLYEWALTVALRHRWKVICGALLLLLLSGWTALTMDRELMPDVDRKRLIVRAVLPPDASLATTSTQVSRMEKRVMKERGVASVLASVGISREILDGRYQSGLNRALLDIELKKTARGADVAHRLESAFTEMSGLAFTISRPESVFEQLFQRQQTQFDVKIVGSRLDTLATVSQRIGDFMRQTPGFVNVHWDLRLGRRAYTIRVDRDAAIRYGIRPEELSRFIERHLEGSTPTRFVDFAEQIDIRVLAEGRDDLDLWRVLRIQYPIRKRNRVIHVPLSRLVRLEPGQDYEEINREEQARTVTITAGLEGLDRTRAEGLIAGLLDRMGIPGGYWIEIGSQYAQMQEQYRNLIAILAISVILVYFILAAQFESLTVPFVIITAVPLASMGVVTSLWLTGNTLNVMSLLGCIVLVGIVVNDSIVKVDFIHRRFRSRGDLRRAILDAGRKRFRPICMTTLTTVCGLLPMALSSGSGAELRRPLAWAIVGGISFATLLTLIVIPVIYSVVVREKIRRCGE